MVGVPVLHEKARKADRRRKVVRVPRNLDLTPYRDEKDFRLLERLVRKEKQAIIRAYGAASVTASMARL